MMNALVDVVNTDHAGLIANEAGQTDPEKIILSGLSLSVEGVSQTALDNALFKAESLYTDKATQTAITAIDQAANSKRAEYITDILGQPTVYERKAREVVDYRTDPTKVGKYLNAEVTERGMTLDDLTLEIEAKEDQWTTVDAQIEAKRVAGKDNVRAATDQAGVEAARDSAVSAIEAL